MKRHPFLRLLCAPAAVGALLFVVPLAAAQRDPTDPARVPCLAVGTALAVLSPSGVMAEAIPAPAQASTPGAAGHVLVLPAPGSFGACADFHGFWAEGAAGGAAAELTVLRPAANSADTGEVVARDAASEVRRGPSVAAQGLQAASALDQPGTYRFVAVLAARAGTATTNAAGQTVSDTLRVPFTVEVRDGGRPVKDPPGAVEGIVVDGAGAPIAGARVTLPLLTAASSGPRPGPRDLVVSGLERGRGGSAPTRGGRSAVTGADGRYRLALPAGSYRAVATARGYATQWYDGVAAAAEAATVTVRSGETTGGVDFRLAAGGATVRPPAPGPTGTIRGTVVGPAGPVEGALVRAQAPATTDPRAGTGDPATGARLVTRTAADGTYALPVPAGRWLVSAEAEGFLRRWYPNAEGTDGATPVEVAAGAEAAPIDFDLPPTPTGVLQGVVTRAGQPLANATVTAVRREADASGRRATRSVATTTDADGAYRLALPPGTYAVGAAGPATSAGVAPVAVWFDHKASLEDADPVTLADGETRTIDFEVP